MYGDKTESNWGLLRCMVLSMLLFLVLRHATAVQRGTLGILQRVRHYLCVKHDLSVMLVVVLVIA